eukprot:scaffold241_cov242-Pinguiococcus_pyrenoidosus.AAC.16
MVLFLFCIFLKWHRERKAAPRTMSPISAIRACGTRSSMPPAPLESTLVLGGMGMRSMSTTISFAVSRTSSQLPTMIIWWDRERIALGATGRRAVLEAFLAIGARQYPAAGW